MKPNKVLVILDYRGFATDEQGRLRRQPSRDRRIIAGVLQTAGVLAEPGRTALDMGSYLEEAARSCYICRLVEGDPSLARHHVVWQDQDTIAFLSQTPTTYGHSLVAPVTHREQVTGDFTLQEYLTLQRVIHALAEAVRQTLRPERLHILSLGGEQPNDHIHWHVVPCPPGLPQEQPLSLLDAHRRGVLHLTLEEGEGLAAQIRAHLPQWMQARQRGSDLRA